MLELNNICTCYGKTEILHGVSLVFSKGKFISVIGPNGSGKSTLLKTVVGIIPNVLGEVLSDGENIKNLSHRHIAKKVAYLSQG